MTNSIKPASFVGIDVSKETLDLKIIPSGVISKFPNDPAGIRQIVALLRDCNVELIVMEATGSYQKLLAAELVAARFRVAVVNPRQVRDFAKATGRLAKNDILDADIIARFAQAVRPEVRDLPDADTEALSALVARRRQLIDMRTAESNRLGVAQELKVKKSINSVLKLLEKQIADVEDELAKKIQESPVWKEKNDLLQSFKGTASATASALLADVPELGTLSRRKICALVGLVPYDHDSGTLRGRRCISGGRANVRCALYMATISATRWNPQIKVFYDGLRARGKHFKVAITACMRKVLTILNMILKTGKPWRDISSDLA